MIFDEEAKKNIEKTGNVWGHTVEYVFNFTIPLPRGYRATFKQKRASSLMGRFGGGWNWEVGIQVGSTTMIINLFVMSIRIGPK